MYKPNGRDCNSAIETEGKQVSIAPFYSQLLGFKMRRCSSGDLIGYRNDKLFCLLLAFVLQSIVTI